MGAIDNGNLNGMFVDSHRVLSVDIRGGQSINISNPDGPTPSFEVGLEPGGPPVGPPIASVAQHNSQRAVVPWSSCEQKRPQHIR